jgi:hypothetical protein
MRPAEARRKTLCRPSVCQTPFPGAWLRRNKVAKAPWQATGGSPPGESAISARDAIDVRATQLPRTHTWLNHVQIFTLFEHRPSRASGSGERPDSQPLRRLYDNAGQRRISSLFEPIRPIFQRYCSPCALRVSPASPYTELPVHRQPARRHCGSGSPSGSTPLVHTQLPSLKAMDDGYLWCGSVPWCKRIVRLRV